MLIYADACICDHTWIKGRAWKWVRAGFFWQVMEWSWMVCGFSRMIMASLASLCTFPQFPGISSTWKILKVPKCSKGQPQPVLAHICPQQLRDSSSWKPSLRNADAYDENAKAPAFSAVVAMAYQSGFVPNGSRASTSCFSWKSKRATANSPSKCRTKSRPRPWTWLLSCSYSMMCQKIAVYMVKGSLEGISPVSITIHSGKF